MNTRHLIDPELVDFLANFPDAILPETLASTRDRVQLMLPLMAAPPEASVQAVEKHLPGPAGAPDVRVLVYTPPGLDKPLPALLHFHGGGYLVGSPELSDAANSFRAAQWGCVIISVDYRLAPETSYPGAVEDGYAALKWLYGNAAALGVDPERIALFGESAGGGLAACLALMARDRGEIPICYQLLVYPMLDDQTALIGNPNPFSGEFVWTNKSNAFAWSALLGGPLGGDAVPPYAAAARAESLAGLPPAFIAVGALDLFVEENVDYARRLLRAGVPAELHVYSGAYHSFDMAAHTQVAQQFAMDCESALRRALTTKA